MNKIILMGRLTANPDYKQTPNGVAVCRFSIAVDRPYQKDKEKEADFISCQAWRNTADFVSKYFCKGKPIIIAGRLQNNDYIDKNNIKHYSDVVLVNEASFVPNDNTQVQTRQQNYQYNSYSNPQNYVQQHQTQEYPQLPGENVDEIEKILSDDEIPF